MHRQLHIADDILFLSVYRRSFDKQKSGKFHSQSNVAVIDAFRWCISNRYPHNAREALTARFIVKGIPEPLFVERAGDIGSRAFPFNHLIANEGARRHKKLWLPSSPITNDGCTGAI